MEDLREKETRSFVNGLLFMAGFLMRDKFIEGGSKYRYLVYL